MEAKYIGVFDSGVGGLTVLKKCREYLPNEKYLYYADKKNVPYGEKSKEEVKEIVFQVVEQMTKYNLKGLIIACNTATSIAVKFLREKYDFPIIGMEPAVKPAVENVEKKKILVIATSLTIKEEKFRNLVNQLNGEKIIDSIPMPGLVHFAEQYDFESKKVMDYILTQFNKIKIKNYETIVLGCTHFIYFRKTLHKLFPFLQIIDGNEGTVKNLENILKKNNNVNKFNNFEIKFLISGEVLKDMNDINRLMRLISN